MNQADKPICVVTGGSSGIGRSIAKHFAQRGARVAILSRNLEKLERVASELSDNGKQIMTLEANVSDAEAMQRAFQQVADRWGNITNVVANAGINGVWAPLNELKVEEWRKTIEVNLTGTFITIQAAVPFMQSNGGSIIVVSSINGTRVFSNTGATAYASSKAGQLALTKMLALELADCKIRVNCVCPGWIETPIHEKTEQRHTNEIGEPVEFPKGSVPLSDGGPGSPEQVAAVVHFLASDEASHVTGSNLYVDGGQSLLEG